MMRILNRVASAAALLVATACATSQAQSPNPYSQDLEGRREIRIEIQNHNFNDATIYSVARGGDRKRLGIVTGKSDSTFTLKWTFSEPLRFEIDLLAGPTCTTDTLAVDPGDTLQLQIAPNTAQMSDWCR